MGRSSGIKTGFSPMFSDIKPADLLPFGDELRTEHCAYPSASVDPLGDPEYDSLVTFFGDSAQNYVPKNMWGLPKELGFLPGFANWNCGDPPGVAYIDDQYAPVPIPVAKKPSKVEPERHGPARPQPEPNEPKKRAKKRRPKRARGKCMPGLFRSRS